MLKRLTAECIGTAWLVIGGCGAAIFAAGVPDIGIGLLGVSLAFGLSVVTMAYAITHISGCHLNPAVTIGLWMNKRFAAEDVFPYIIAQVVGATLGAAILYFILSGKTGIDIAAAGFATNGFGEHSPGGFSLQSALITEIVMTFMFVMVILGATDSKSHAALAPLAIGLCLTLIHLISIPVTNTSVNPARSTGVAIIEGGWAIDQLWLFWVAPIVGAVLAGLTYRWFQKA